MQNRLLSAAAAVTFLLAGPTAAHASSIQMSTNGSDPVAWAVRPSDGEVADGRTTVELDLDPGESMTEHLVVTNLSDIDTEFTLTAADGYVTPNGRFNMLPADQKSVDAGTWISFDTSSVTVAAGQSSVVPFVIDVPENATPGDHPAGVAASLRSVTSGSDGAAMAVDSRVGFRVMARVAGELRPSLSLGDLDARYQSGWNPFEPGAITLSYVVHNTGNTRISTTASGEVSGPLSVNDKTAGEAVELLPGDRHQYSATISRVWPLGFAIARVTVSGYVVPTAGVRPSLVTEEVTVWAVPWSQLAVIAGLALLIFAFMWGRRRQRAKVTRLVAEARKAGARESRSMLT